MRSRIPESLARRLPTKSQLLSSLVVAALLLTIVGLYALTGASFGGNAIGDTSSNRDRALQKAQEYIAENFDGLSAVELADENLQEKDGRWMLVFSCIREQAGGSETGGEAVTLRIFVDADLSGVWGFSNTG